MKSSTSEPGLRYSFLSKDDVRFFEIGDALNTIHYLASFLVFQFVALMKFVFSFIFSFHLKSPYKVILLSFYFLH